MNPMRKTIAAALLAACCATTFAAGQDAAPDAGRNAGQGMHGGPEGGPDRGHGPGFGHGFGHRFGHGDGPGFGHLAGTLQLTEAQKDKLFAIEHAAAPQRRQQQKALRHAHQAMHALRDADRFDEARAGAASRELGDAVAAAALLQARVHAQAMAVLTPEQREQLRQRRAQARHERP